jgi:hypothetical protein
MKEPLMKEERRKILPDFFIASVGWGFLRGVPLSLNEVWGPQELIMYWKHISKYEI